jgi:hypothetical protein
MEFKRENYGGLNMESLTCELNGIKYLCVDEIYTNSNNKRLKIKLKKYEAIEQGVKDAHISFWSHSYIVVRVLVPEKNIVAYNNDSLND